MSTFKEFLFPKKEGNQFDTATVMINSKEDVKMNNEKPNIIKPLMFAEVEGIANQLISGKSIIVDLTETNIEQAKRICDFLNGVTFTLNGSVEKVAKLVYLFNPRNG